MAVIKKKTASTGVSTNEDVKEEKKVVKKKVTKKPSSEDSIKEFIEKANSSIGMSAEEFRENLKKEHENNELPEEENEEIMNEEEEETSIEEESDEDIEEKPSKKSSGKKSLIKKNKPEKEKKEKKESESFMTTDERNKKVTELTAEYLENKGYDALPMNIIATILNFDQKVKEEAIMNGKSFTSLFGKRFKVKTTEATIIPPNPISPNEYYAYPGIRVSYNNSIRDVREIKSRKNKTITLITGEKVEDPKA